VRTKLAKMARLAGIGTIVCYQKCLSRLKPPCCRFLPTCSVYAREAIARFGLFRGGLLALRRLLRCHPFYRGPAYDPVPPLETRRCQCRRHESGMH